MQEADDPCWQQESSSNSSGLMDMTSRCVFLKTWHQTYGSTWVTPVSNFGNWFIFSCVIHCKSSSCAGSRKRFWENNALWRNIWSALFHVTKCSPCIHFPCDCILTDSRISGSKHLITHTQKCLIFSIFTQSNLCCISVGWRAKTHLLRKAQLLITSVNIPYADYYFN